MNLTSADRYVQTAGEISRYIVTIDITTTIFVVFNSLFNVIADRSIINLVKLIGFDVNGIAGIGIVIAAPGVIAAATVTITRAVCTAQE